MNETSNTATGWRINLLQQERDRLDTLIPPYKNHPRRKGEKERWQWKKNSQALLRRQSPSSKKPSKNAVKKYLSEALTRQSGRRKIAAFNQVFKSGREYATKRQLNGRKSKLEQPHDLLLSISRLRFWNYRRSFASIISQGIFIIRIQKNIDQFGPGTAQYIDVVTSYIQIKCRIKLLRMFCWTQRLDSFGMQSQCSSTSFFNY